MAESLNYDIVRNYEQLSLSFKKETVIGGD